MKSIDPGYDSTAWRFSAVCVVIFAAGCSAESNPRSWDLQGTQTLTYELVVNMAHDGRDFTERDERVIEIVIEAGKVSISRSSKIEETKKIYGPYELSADGAIGGPQALVNPPPLEAELILHVFPPGGLGTGELPPKWDTVDPHSALLDDSKIEFQQRSEFALLSSRSVGGSDIEDYSLRSTVRLIDNSQLSLMIGLPSERGDDLKDTINELSRDNLFLFGAVSWNRQDRVTESGEVTYVSAPHPGGTEASIGASDIRQEMTIRRR